MARSYKFYHALLGVLQIGLLGTSVTHAFLEVLQFLLLGTSVTHALLEVLQFLVLPYKGLILLIMPRGGLTFSSIATWRAFRLEVARLWPYGFGLLFARWDVGKYGSCLA